jgi:hypothetical protein
MTSEVHRSAASGLRSLEAVRPRVCFIIREGVLDAEPSQEHLPAAVDVDRGNVGRSEQLLAQGFQPGPHADVHPQYFAGLPGNDRNRRADRVCGVDAVPQRRPRGGGDVGRVQVEHVGQYVVPVVGRVDGPLVRAFVVDPAQHTAAQHVDALDVAELSLEDPDESGLGGSGEPVVLRGEGEQLHGLRREDHRRKGAAGVMSEPPAAGHHQRRGHPVGERPLGVGALADVLDGRTLPHPDLSARPGQARFA